MTRSLIPALVICAGAAALEGVLAGHNVKQRFAQLHMPRGSPSLRVWIVIGASYYVVCCVVLYRLLALPPSDSRTVALSLIAVVLLGNAIWNYLFFRLLNLRASFIEGLVYSVVALVLLNVLYRVDRVAAWCLLPYAVYLAYANWWGYAVWQANAAASRL